MPGTDKSTGRVVALVALLILAAIALRGYLPGIAPPRGRSTGSPAALIFVAALVTVSIGIVAVAIVLRWRDRGAGASGAVSRSMWSRGGGRPGRRTLLIALAAIAAWLLMVALVTGLGGLGPPDVEQPLPGTESSPPASGSGTEPPPRPEQPPASGNMFRFLVAASVVFLLVAAMGMVFAPRRKRRPWQSPMFDDDRPDAGARESASPESLARAAEVGLAEIGDLSREPRQAIIACYAAMERELAHVPDAAPQECDTPSEVLARAVDHHALHAESAKQLVDLFTEARFSPHVMTEEHREVAVRALQLVLAELRSLV